MTTLPPGMSISGAFGRLSPAQYRVVARVLAGHDLRVQAVHRATLAGLERRGLIEAPPPACRLRFNPLIARALRIHPGERRSPHGDSFMTSTIPAVFRSHCHHCRAEAIATEGDSSSGFRTRFACGSTLTSEEGEEPRSLCDNAATTSAAEI